MIDMLAQMKLAEEERRGKRARRSHCPEYEWE
jgi:hypothetical protein